ncbi:phage tail protein [Cupriavidus necator N-1]|uniref:Phage tail protein n=1 Tax=Cupriavidus necator (strain ATCC 43291 / DSM 13513 / CCUG 52238 / LMG 8453 / N-1) TaxID=1042878 RepID=G0ES86_CUPNN|nr:tail fiber protein [Cupriavidus necator]AEI76704.1 phage tail protein [Cupriavidus necator N-1]MDX6014722.1 tail fiber protein [Cupriavidus necator]
MSRTVYSDLWNEIGSTFGAGDGSTTFNLPELRGEFLRGWDDGRGVDAGRAFGSAQASQNLEHTHGNGAGSNGYWVDAPGLGVINIGGATLNINRSNTTGNSAVGTAGTEARSRNIALLACIKY